MGAVMPEALAAWEELSGDIPGPRPARVTSPDLLHRGWTAAQAARWRGEREPSHVEQLLSRSRLRPASSPSPTPRRPRCRGSAACSASASPRSASRRFGQTGSLADLYAAYRLDGAAITEAVAELLLPA